MFAIRIFLSLILLAPILVSAKPEKVTLACVDCWSTPSLYPKVMNELFPNIEVDWIFIKTHTYDASQMAYMNSFPEGTVFLDVDPSDAVEFTKAIDFMKSKNIRDCLGGGDRGSHVASLFNHELGFVDNDPATANVRRLKLLQAQALRELAIPTFEIKDLSDVDRALSKMPQGAHQRVVIKYNGGAAGVGLGALPLNNPGQIKAKVEALLLSEERQRYGFKDTIIIQAEVLGPQYYAQTFTLNGVTTLTGLYRAYKITRDGTILSFVDRPLDLKSDIAKTLGEVMSKSNSRLGVVNGLSHTEMIYDLAAKTWRIVDPNSRAVGSGIAALDKKIWGIGQLELRLLRTFDPTQLEEELKSFPRPMLMDGAVLAVPISETIDFSASDVAELRQLPSRLIPAPHYEMKAGQRSATKDLFSASLSLFAGSSDDVIAGVKATVEKFSLSRIENADSDDCQFILADDLKVVLEKSLSTKIGEDGPW